MKEHPILFSGEMVRAILEGRKTQTRRVIKQVRGCKEFLTVENDIVSTQEMLNRRPANAAFLMVHCPYGKSGDRLWVRETHHIDLYPDETVDAHGNPGIAHYRADTDVISQSWGGQWRPSIFMPRWASRITLEVVSVRVERVQDISEADAKAEGVTPKSYIADHLEHIMYRSTFHLLWDRINAKRGFPWSSNPWVWVVSFAQL